MIKILAIDTSTDACSAALSVGDKIEWRFEVLPKHHTKLILSMIEELLNSAQVEINQLDAIAFGCGPGSFTGVRLAASIAQGLAFAANLPVVKISSLRALAQELYYDLVPDLPMLKLRETSSVGSRRACHPKLEERRVETSRDKESLKVLVAQDARMGEIYCGEYQADKSGIMQPIVDDRLIKPQDLDIFAKDGLIGVGSGFEVYSDLLANNITVVAKQHVDAKCVLELAISDFSKGLFVDAKDALPVYLRDKINWGQS